ncbi:hypothetical protein ARMGADRAFT_545207 [Armillaria gallica]|uniref:Uncharacterized protein n=1 Tax=Armillaria gallica TaxID=47427 RepID=A0A2H3CS15_ARMGA|nr:hypothetical protein ARMGADRAFT_545207 [Armillaria gallica]
MDLIGSSFIVVQSRVSATLYGAYRLCPRRYGQQCYDTGSMQMHPSSRVQSFRRCKISAVHCPSRETLLVLTQAVVMSFELTPPGSAVPTHFTRATTTDIFIAFSAKTLGVLCASHLRIIRESNSKHQSVMNSSDQPFIVLLDRSSNPSRVPL